MSRRHEAEIKNFIGAAGTHLTNRDVSPQFVQGQKNRGYINPTFSSNIFTGKETRRQTKSRLRTTNKDVFGNEIYRNTLYRSKSPIRSELSANEGRPRTPRSTIEIRSRNENQIDTQRLAEDDVPRSRVRTPVPESVHASNTGAVQVEQYSQSQQQESVAEAQAPSEFKEVSQVSANPQNEVAQDYAEPQADFYPRFDDRIFARTQFSPDKNKIVYTEKIPANQDIKYTNEHPMDPVAVYEQDAKNQLIAIEKVVDNQNEKHQVLHEEKAMLDDLIDQEESKRLEAKLRRDYRKKIDHYHINQTDNQFYEDKVLRVTKTRAKANTIKAEAARIANEKQAEVQGVKARQAAYKAELDQMTEANKTMRVNKKRTHYDAERMHKGLPIGERDHRRYGRNIMKTLRTQIQEKFNFRKKLDELAKSSNLNDFMAYKSYLDGVQKQIEGQNKKRQSGYEAASKKVNSSPQKGRKKRVTRQKKADVALIQNLAEHDQNVMAFESARKSALKQELKLGLEKQLQQKSERFHETRVVEHFESQLVDPGIGSNSYRPLRNYDQRSDIHLKGYIHTEEFVDEKTTDRQMVQTLDKYDKLVQNREAEIKADKKEYLASCLKDQMEENAEKDF